MRFPWQKKKEFFTAEETQQLVAAIQNAEQRTSGEVRLFIESKCRFIDAFDRAKEIFIQLKMDKTELRNATLIYIAIDDKQAAVMGDEGIHQKVGQEYWKAEVAKMLQQFRAEKLVDGICVAITDLGEALQHHFPYNSDTDKNELPDEIIFGR
ncbi:MAG TPA: TPM domain-containing protein [Flavisolibacter sp.]|nr:TPM domain-containing protein [Flavisolibacter sp.]